MFGPLKKKPNLTPQEDLYAVMSGIYRSLLRADKLDGMERYFAVATAFGASIRAIHEAFPNVTIESDGPAMTVLSAGADNPDWEKVHSDVEFSIQQARDCPEDPDAIMIVVSSLLAPQNIENRFAKARQEAG